MLLRLAVSNLAIVEKAEAEFAPGLNVLTGETGAGKSVLMGALELVLGGRADFSVVRDGAREALVEAEFSDLPPRVLSVLAEAGIGAEGGVLVIRRTVGTKGAGRVRVNESSATVATLRTLGKALVDIHGPRANQHVLEERFQRETLDAFGGLADGAEATAYAAAWRGLADVRERIRALGTGEASEDELDLLRYQIGELEEANVTEEDDDLAERHAAAAHAAEAVEAANAITEALGGDESAGATLGRLGPLFAAAAKHFPAAAEWASEAEELSVRVQELSRTVADAASGLEADPESFEALDARLTLVSRLRRKYGDPMAALARKRTQLSDLENRGGRLAELEQAAVAARARLVAAGSALSVRRHAAAQALAQAVTGELHALGFLQAKFAVRLEASEPESHGCDAVSFMFEPNPGESARPLADIASSGETARVMLALKGVLAAHDETDVLVFDEVDANLGGETGAVVGAKMKALARTHQVIAITHLPQSAVWGDRHLKVSKAVSGGRTRTQISAVEGEARIAEIARMLGGENITSVVRKHAEELLFLSR